jgi:amidase
MIDPARLTARDAASRIAAGSLTSEALVRACLERIAAREPEVMAWQHLDPEQAIAAAQACDRGPARGPLHGIPVGVKDIMDTADMPTTYGSRAYPGNRPAGDAACVALTRAAGGIILGKTVTTEFAALNPGKTRNPHDRSRTPGGSSSGSAAGVGDFMVPLAFGTQTAGSIIRPASFCGVVGYKPSFGLVAISGTKVLSPSLDTVGGFARSVADIAFFVAALTDRPSLVPQGPAARPRVGVYRTAPWERAEPATTVALERAASRLSQAGAQVAERPPLAALDGLTAAQNTVMIHEAARNLAWERLNRAAELGPRTLAMLEEGAGVSAAVYDEAMREMAAARSRVEELFDGHDALLVPSAPGEAPDAATTGDALFNRPWTALHLPCVTIPAGHGPAGLPVGVQFVGRPRDDARLLAIALLAESALGTAA